MKALLHRSILLPSCGHERPLLCVGLIHFVFLLFVGMPRYLGCLTSAFDLGSYDQSLLELCRAPDDCKVRHRNRAVFL